MAYELLLLSALIFVFMISFCGLLQKIKQSYERERIIAERLARQRAQTTSNGSFDEVYTISAFRNESDGNSGIFPEAPPPYAFVCPPPKYEEVIKNEISGDSTVNPPNSSSRASNATVAPAVHTAPPYTIS